MAVQGGIELKEAASNPLLGQMHLQSGGRFVKAKLPSADEGYRKAKTLDERQGLNGVKGANSSRGSTPRHAGVGHEESSDDDMNGLPVM